MISTYHCSWCGWNGTGIEEQRTTADRYACWQCGQDVEPGPHSDHPGFGNVESEGE